MALMSTFLKSRKYVCTKFFIFFFVLELQRICVVVAICAPQNHTLISFIKINLYLSPPFPQQDNENFIHSSPKQFPDKIKEIHELKFNSPGKN